MFLLVAQPLAGLNRIETRQSAKLDVSSLRGRVEWYALRRILRYCATYGFKVINAYFICCIKICIYTHVLLLNFYPLYMCISHFHVTQLVTSLSSKNPTRPEHCTIFIKMCQSLQPCVGVGWSSELIYSVASWRTRSRRLRRVGRA